jgi:N4-bis(aminopropyl)spermidine synthase
MHPIFIEVAEATSLREGPAGVERFFWTVFQKERWTSRELSQDLRIPIPVVAAVRRELEKRGLLERGDGFRLSSRGRTLAEGLWGKASNFSVCPVCNGSGRTPIQTSGRVLEGLRGILATRPERDVALDQAHLTEECVIRKARFLIREGMVLGKRIFFPGDDDFLSAAILFLISADMGRESLNSVDVMVLDIDKRIVETLDSLARSEDLPLRAELGDVREPLPEGLRGKFDTIMIDPPYTLRAFDIFLQRGLEALDPDGGRIVLSFGSKAAPERLAMQRILCEKGLVMDIVEPGFNRYETGTVLGNQSDLILLTRVVDPVTLGEGDPFYTIEGGGGSRPYRCLGCGVLVSTGPGLQFSTVGRLKESGCPQCGGGKFRYARKRKR